MTTVAKKLQLGTAALAVAASAALIAPMVAVADESDSGSDSVGSSAAKTPKREKRGAAVRNDTDNSPTAPSAPTAPSGPADLPSIPTADSSADATGDRPLIQNSLIWIGKPNPTPPAPQTEIYSFTPLADLPGFSKPMFGWMDGFDFEACVLGLSSTTTGMIGPYGTSKTQFSGQGC